MTTVARKKRSDKRISRQQDDRLELRPQNERRRRYTPPKHSACESDANGRNEGLVGRTETRDGFIVRYIYCLYCGQGYKHVLPLEKEWELRGTPTT